MYILFYAMTKFNILRTRVSRHQHFTNKALAIVNLNF